MTGSRCWAQALNLTAWLRNLAHGYSMVALDTYRDNLCLWRCIVLHRGVRPDRSTVAARALARGFFESSADQDDTPKHRSMNLLRLKGILTRTKPFSDWFGIRVYEPKRLEEDIVVWHLIRNVSAKLITNIMTIGIYEGHAFLIKNIARLAKTYECFHCHARFTKFKSLQRHAERCAQGETVIDCPTQKVETPHTVFEKAFYPNEHASEESLRWVARDAKRRKIHIYHARCGERWVEGAPVDGYYHKTRTVFQYHSCHWHGCPRCYPDRKNNQPQPNARRQV